MAIVTAPHQQSIVVADDDANVRRLLQLSLAASGYTVQEASDGATALALCTEQPPDLLLLDLDMPGADGISVLATLRADPMLREIPTIVVTGSASTEDLLRCFRLGARDFLRKPFDPAELEARINATLAVEQRSRRMLAENDELLALATTDVLTGLPNRRALLQHLRWVASRADLVHEPWGLLLVDVDHLKRINDQHGHSAGDVAICKAAAALTRCARTNDVVGRWAGDEFLVVLAGANHTTVTQVAERIRIAASAHPDTRRAGDVAITVSVGGTAATGGDPVIVLEQVDAALYQAKAAGRNQVTVL